MKIASCHTLALEILKVFLESLNSFDSLW